MELFSETTRLYAKNYSIVEAAKGEFQKDVAAFLNNVYEMMKSETCKLRQEVKAGYCSWWIGEPEEENCPYLWLSCSAPEIVDPGEITLHVAAKKLHPTNYAPLKALRVETSSVQSARSRRVNPAPSSCSAPPSNTQTKSLSSKSP